VTTVNGSVKHSQLQHLQNINNSAVLRQNLYNSIRNFFQKKNFLEVSTPVRVRAPAQEEHINAISAGQHYLRTSPELQMKQLLTAGYHNIYQIGPCFRKGETGQLHSPEFTMLEWYRADSDCWDILLDCGQLLLRCLSDLHASDQLQYRGQCVDLNTDWQIMSVDKAFETFTTTTTDKAIADNQFEELLVSQILPEIDNTVPLVLHDFPAQLGGLARPKTSNPDRLERWELYIAGIEIANAYTELTDHNEYLLNHQRAAERRRRRKQEVYPQDQDFIAASQQGIPDSGGIALGVDRWLMMLADANKLDEVIAFPEKLPEP